MSPEQSQGCITPGCDLYALGLIVFEMLTGERAIPMGLGKSGDLPGAVRSHLGKLITSEAIEVLTSALQYDAAARPSSIGDWGRRLAALLV
jgi:serine/threonine protein kinase